MTHDEAVRFVNEISVPQSTPQQRDDWHEHILSCLLCQEWLNQGDADLKDKGLSETIDAITSADIVRRELSK